MSLARDGSGSRSQALEDLKDLIVHSVRLSFADSDTQYFVQPSVLKRRGFEKRRCSQIVIRGSDPLTAGDPSIHLRGSMAYTTISHENQCAVVSSKDQAHVLLRRPISTN